MSFDETTPVSGAPVLAQPIESLPFDYASEKRRILWKLVGVVAAVGVWDGAFPEESLGDFGQFVEIFISVARFLAIGVYASHWCYCDDLEHDRKPSRTLAGVTIIVAPLGVGLHLLRARGVRGVFGCMLLIAFWGALCAVDATCVWLAEICCRIFR